LDGPEKIKEMGENGRQYFFEHFERKIIMKQWKDVLKKALIFTTNNKHDFRLKG